jgi:hypothetical protein
MCHIVTVSEKLKLKLSAGGWGNSRFKAFGVIVADAISKNLRESAKKTKYELSQCERTLSEV